MLNFVVYIALTGLVTCQTYTSIPQSPGLQGDVDSYLNDATSFLRQYDIQAIGACHSLVTAQWDYATNVTEKGAELAALEQSRYDKFLRAAWRRAEVVVPWRSLSVSQPRIYRLFLRLASRARNTAGLSEERVAEMQELLKELRDIYSRTLVCPSSDTEKVLANLAAAAAAATRSSHRCTLRLEPELSGIMRTSRDPAILSFAWKAWRDAVGPPSKHRFMRLVQLSNDAARRNVFMTVDACKAPEVRVMLLMEFTIQPVPVVNEVKVTLGEYDIQHFSGLGILICNILSAQWGKQRKTNSLLISASRLIGFRDIGEQWRAEFEQDLSRDTGPGVMEAASQAWNRIEPLYRQLHAYVRRKLATYYGAALVKHRAPIPAHLLGNMWAQSWSGIEDLVMPYPNKKLPDISSELSRQGYTPLGMLQVAEAWFTSIGLPAMPEDFWRRSIFQRPTDRSILCGASAWDFCNGRDYRIKMCANPTLSDFISAHHELSHVQYYMHYASQPSLFRDGANPALHEAVGEMVGLSITSPDHLQRLGLFPGNLTNDEEIHLNYLMRVALDKLAFIPFSYLVDLWRWRVFAGEWDTNEMNERWWQLRVTLQGVAPPVRRSHVDFDPATKRHIATHRPYIGYMVSGLLQFQLLQALCRASGHRGPLHRCDLQNRREAGRLLSQIMSMGASRPWPEILSVINGGVPAYLMDPEALIEFFQPLEQWLRVQNGREGLEGWDTAGLESEYFSPLTATGGSSVFVIRNYVILIAIFTVYARNVII